jgi:hypothetical protein
MSKELKVYNQFQELILHVEYVRDRGPVLRVIDGTPELRRSIKLLEGQPFERAILIDGQLREYRSSWGDKDFLDCVAGYWSANFGWRVRLLEKATTPGKIDDQEFLTAYHRHQNVLLANIRLPITEPSIVPCFQNMEPLATNGALAALEDTKVSLIGSGLVHSKIAFCNYLYQATHIAGDDFTDLTFTGNTQSGLASVTELDQSRKPKLTILELSV